MATERTHDDWLKYEETVTWLMEDEDGRKIGQDLNGLPVFQTPQKVIGKSAEWDAKEAWHAYWGVVGWERDLTRLPTPEEVIKEAERRGYPFRRGGHG